MVCKYKKLATCLQKLGSITLPLPMIKKPKLRNIKKKKLKMPLLSINYTHLVRDEA